MKLCLYHGYELSGSGSNEYTRYLARELARRAPGAVLVSREPEPAAFSFVERAVDYDAVGTPTELFVRPRELPGGVSLHRLPATSVYPVYVKDKQRAGNVKAFAEMTDAEVAEYRDAMCAVLTRVLEDERPDVVQANHLVYQPWVAARACAATGVPYYVVPHGSAIEYAVKRDPRMREAARLGLASCSGVVWISNEVRERVLALFDELAGELSARGSDVRNGTDTSLFAPVPRSQRRAALDRLVAMPGVGGKTAAQKRALHEALAAGRLDELRELGECYDHKQPDADLGETLARLPADGDLLLFVGSLTHGKGVQSLLTALPALLSRRPDTHLLVVGSGRFREVLEALAFSLETSDLSLFDRLVERGRELEGLTTRGPMRDLQHYAASPDGGASLRAHGPRLAGRVHFLGRLDHDRLRHVFPCCTLAVFPSVVSEASPLVFAEAMANGVLPVGADHSGLRDGLLALQPHLPAEVWAHMGIDPAMPARVASIAGNVQALLELLERRDLSGQLRALAVAHHDWSATAEGTAEAARLAAARALVT